MQIKGLEAELKKQDTQDKMLKNGEEMKPTESFLQLVRDDSFFPDQSIINLSSVLIIEWHKETQSQCLKCKVLNYLYMISSNGTIKRQVWSCTCAV